MDGWLGKLSPLVFLAALQCAVLAAPGAALAQEAPAPPVPDKLGFAWVRIPGGEFTMGADDGDGDERPAHKVRVKDFSLARTEVTQAQWRAVTGETHPSAKECDACPVTGVSWDEAQVFLEKAGGLLGESLRLPTEAEWEYAAGGGAKHQKWAGTDSDLQVRDFAWLGANSKRATHPACEKQPNLFGLCDMSGNVWEWCADFYDRGYYEASPAADPTGPEAGENRVLRGGCWSSHAGIARVTQRYNSWGGAQTPYYGFRPAK
jgi:formylglycine-generating enzyme required for sulfatase activity